MNRCCWMMLYLLCLLTGLRVIAAEPDPLPAEVDTAFTDAYGTVKQYYRAMVREVDLGMPIWRDGQRQAEGVYRLRDRKNRDLLFYAYLRTRTDTPSEYLAQSFLRSLGTQARRATDKVTGVVTVFEGDPDNCRVVTITPQAGACLVQQERIRRYTVPPRVYTAGEQQVIRLVNEVNDRYQAAQRVRYTVVQRNAMQPPQGADPPALTWQVDFARPKSLAVRATVKDQVGLDIATAGDTLRVTRPFNPAEERTQERPLGDALSSEDVPELDSDIVARMMLGDRLFSDEVDALALRPVGELPLHQQVEIVLTYPEEQMTLHLWVDRQRRAILRAVTIITGEKAQSRVTREYTNLVLEPAQTATPPQQPPPASTDAVKAP